jgi:L-fuconolactonase
MHIDAHHHFWRYNPIEYGWMNDGTGEDGNSMRAIQRDFLPEDLKPELMSAGIDGVVSVHARDTVKETSWLLNLAQQHEFVKGVVGWVPLVSHELPSVLGTLVSNPKLKAVRHVLQWEADDDYMLRADFNAGIKALRAFDLTYDILIYERHLPQTIEFVDRHPNQIFVLDHLAKPRIRDRVLSPWRENIIELAKRENVYCKVSGMVTEADYQFWNEEDLHPYFDTVLRAFGPRRLMFGSDWPVSLLACAYGRWCEIVLRQIQGYSSEEKDRILGGTAEEVYKLA